LFKELGTKLTQSLSHPNFCLADIPAGGDLAMMVYHHLHAYFPVDRDQLLEYAEAEFSFDPTSSASVTTQESREESTQNATECH